MDCSRRRSEEEEEEEEERSAREEGEEVSEEEEASSSWARWLLALDVQVMGACRSDERSLVRPLSLLRLRLSPNLDLCLPGPAAQDRLLAHLTQRFEVSEIGLLVRCLCAPLVSIRVGKINRLGTLLCPIPSRGQLNLNMALSSWLRLSFVGDDGRTEQLGLISCNSSEVDSFKIEEIASDASGRSFLAKLSEFQVFYYWLSEKSLSHGLHLLGKMKDMLRRRPTLSDLTGISSSRLDSLGTHWQACLASPNLAGAKSSASSTSSSSSSSSPGNAGLSRPHPHRTSTSTLASSMSSWKGGGASLSPRGKTCFKDGSSSSSSLRTMGGGIRDNKLKRRLSTDCHVGPLAVPSLPFNPAPTAQPPQPSGAVSDGLSAGLPPQFAPFNPLTFQFPLPPPDHAPSKDKPQYCWCPIGPSPVPSLLPPLPPVAVPSSLSLSLSLSLSRGTASSDLTQVLRDPLVHLPLPVTSLIIPPLPGSSQFPAFTGLMSDPIVHVPVMDIHSSGQAYLVSAGPTMSTAIPPLLGKPLVPVTESVVEKNARETLMRLLESAPAPNPIHAVAFGMDPFSSAFSSLELGSSSEEAMSSKANEQEDNEHEQETGC